MHKRHRLIKWLSLLFISLILTNCGGDGSTTDEHSATTNDGTTQDTNNTEIAPVKLYDIKVYSSPLSYEEFKLSPLTDNDFNALSKANKYQIATKLYATLFYGTTYETLDKRINSDAFITHTRSMFDKDNDSAEISSVEDKLETYEGWSGGETIGPMIGRLFHFKPGKEYTNRWAAYILTQTILFSPAFELDTVYTIDALGVYNSLVRSFDQGHSLQWTTFTHMISNENWRRFRSPEDNGREMMEIFLMDFNDAHVPLAGKALKNWQLDRGSDTLIVTLNENTTPINNLFEGQSITNGTDFYSAVVQNTNFLKTVSTRLIDIYFPNYSTSQKDTLITQLVSSKVSSWTDLLKQIVYSKEYLLNSTKTRSLEESFLPIAKTLNWHPHKYSFHYIYQNLNNMRQSTMRYKLGRKTQVPLDSQSFAWFHKTMREDIMMNHENDTSFEDGDDGWEAKELFKNMPTNIESEDERAAYIVKSLFLSIVGRDATTKELTFFQDLIDSDKYNSNTFRNFGSINLGTNEDHEDNLKERGEFASLVLDYLSRLSETYAFEAVK